MLILIFGFLTLTCRVAKNISYKSKWYISSSSSKYTFDDYKKDLKEMSDEDIIENMAAELYKLNDINFRKTKVMSLTMKMFFVFLITSFIVIIMMLGFLL